MTGTSMELQREAGAKDVRTDNMFDQPEPMPFGAELQADGVRFAFWAPAVESVRVQIEGLPETLPMQRGRNGWFELLTDTAKAGSRYSFVLPDGMKVPDPASRHQPEDVHGPSEVIDPSQYQWNDAAWQGRPWTEAVLYELHVGAFTEEGTFRSAIEKLDHLAGLGITALQMMPVADFPGRWNWGYDGVLLYAPDSSYGRPEEMKALVDAAHARGMMVMLDVVYNHFGPDGNYLPTYAKEIFTDHHSTPWGSAVNYDAEGSGAVREFVIQNALYWLREYHLDGLRLDAVHQIKDDSDTHLLDELADRVRAEDWGRPIHLVLENEKNQAQRLIRDDDGQPLLYTAQWNDDMHHVLHTAATLEGHGYYGDYLEDTEKLGRALAEGFAFQGEMMQSIDRGRGEPSAFLPPTAFIAFMQNHDQIGNRAFGERINAIASPEAVHAIASVYLLLPQVPMLFMGEEWGSSQPFPFFCDFSGDLAAAVSKGRREEFASFPEFKDPEQRDRIPDPEDPQTFRSGKLDWNQATQGVHAEWIGWYRNILAVRRTRALPLLQQIVGHAGSYQVLAPGAVVVRWRVNAETQLQLEANLSDTSVSGFAEPRGIQLWQEGPPREGDLLRPWSVVWSVLQKTATS